MDRLNSEWTDPAASDGHDSGPDPEYVRATRMMMEEEKKRRKAEEARRREATPVPPQLSPGQKAELMGRMAGATFLYGAAGTHFGELHDTEAFKVLLDGFMERAGSPVDPVERMLVEQMVLAHFAAGRMHFRAGTQADLGIVTGCLTVAARLSDEVRKTALALEAYRVSAMARAARAAAKEKEEKEREAKKAAKGRRRPVAATNGDGPHRSLDTELATNGQGCSRLKEYFDGLAEPALLP